MILTGTRGSGKTTLLTGLFPQELPGLTTWAEPKKAVYLRENTSGETVQVGAFDASLPGPGNQMVLLQDGFTALGVPALQRCMESDSPWITIDEIGYLEAQSEAYHDALRQLLATKQVAAVIRKQDLPFLQELCSREDSFVVDLDDPFGNIGCVIMASGMGKRFGGNKLMAPFLGKPLICQILDTTEGIFSQRVVVTRHPEVARLCEELGVPTVLHDFPHRSDTVRLGLEALGQVETCAFCPGDQPLLRNETVMALALAAKNMPKSICRAYFEDTDSAPVFFPEWLFQELKHLPEGKGGGFLIKKYPEYLRKVSAGDRYELLDIDRPEDLEFLLEHASELRGTEGNR